MSRVCLSADGCLLELWPCFAGLDALVPRVMKLGVIGTSAVSEPRTTATTTTDFSRFLDGATLGTYQPGCRRRDCSCVYAGICQNTKRKTRKQPLFALREDLSTCRYSWTYVCRPRRPQTTCDQRCCCQHLHTSYTKHRQERNNWLCRIS